MLLSGMLFVIILLFINNYIVKYICTLFVITDTVLYSDVVGRSFDKC